MKDPQRHTTIVIFVTDGQTSTRIAQFLSDQNFLVPIFEGFALGDLATRSLLALDGCGNHDLPPRAPSPAADGRTSRPASTAAGTQGQSRQESIAIWPGFAFARTTKQRRRHVRSSETARVYSCGSRIANSRPTGSQRRHEALTRHSRRTSHLILQEGGEPPTGRASV